MKQKKSPTKKPPAPVTLRKEAKALRQQAELLEIEAMRLAEPAKCQRAAFAISERTGNVAVFLGAGASRTFGWPLTNQLLPTILDGIVEKDLFKDIRINTRKEDRIDRELLAKALKALCPGIRFTRAFLTKNQNRLPLVTSLLSVLDYSLSSGQSLVSGLSPDEIKNRTDTARAGNLRDYRT